MIPGNDSPSIPSQEFHEWQRKALRSLGSNADFVRETRHGFLALRQHSPLVLAALEALLPDPDRLFHEARILKPGSRTHAGVVEIAGVKYLLKRYNCRGWLYRLGNAVRRSRALRAWLVNWYFLVRGIPVPVPLLCLEERRWRLLERSYVLMEFVENALTLRERWTRLGENEKRDFLEFCGNFLGRMHRMGMLHGDLKWDNILVGEIPSPDNLRLVDLDGSTTMKRFSHRRARKDFDRFLKDLAKHEGSDHLRDTVIRAWERGLA